MARLKVFLSGQFRSVHELSSSRDVVVGRGETCDIVMKPEPGISRQHFRVRNVDGKWNVEVLSRYGELYLNSERQTSFELYEGMTFSVPPYEFVFESESPSASYSEDKTHVGYMASVASLKLMNHKGQIQQNFMLDGTSWIAGRDTSCSIFIDHGRVSRQQFKIQKQDETYFICDMNSVNGTLLNGRQISADDWTALSSGDLIAVADWSLQFELRDAQFEQRLSEIDPSLMDEAPYAEAAAEQPGPAPHSYYQALPGAAPQGASFADMTPPPAPRGMKLFGVEIPGLTPARLVLGALIVLAGVYLATQQDEKPVPTPAEAKLINPFDKLPPDKQQVVKQLYLTAQALLAQQKYELARQETLKLHQIVPYYEDSKQIEETATQGQAILEEKAKAEAEERQRAQIEEKIQLQVAQCKSQINFNSESSWLDSCLSSVVEFNPEHPAIQALRLEVNRISEERELKKAQQKDYSERVARLMGLFNKAQKIEKEGLPLPAIDAYEKVVGSKLPDPNKVIPAAKRQIASLQDGIVSQQADAEKKAEQAFRSGQMKQAILLLRKGMQINPDNEVLKGRHTQYMLDLRKQMMTLYQEGILEESVGEVESAKVKWRKIQEQSLPGEDYFEKSKLKLKKYGVL